MSAQRAVLPDEHGDDEMLDVETSAALLRWMETAAAPDGIDPERWRHWAENGCRGRIDADGGPVTPAMLGHWGRTGSLR